MHEIYHAIKKYQMLNNTHPHDYTYKELDEIAQLADVNAEDVKNYILIFIMNKEIEKRIESSIRLYTVLFDKSMDRFTEFDWKEISIHANVNIKC
jgi:hypothetical protein